MTDIEIDDFMKKWDLTPTEAAFILGVSLATLQNARGGKRLSEKYSARMAQKKAQFELSKDHQDGPEAA